MTPPDTKHQTPDTNRTQPIPAAGYLGDGLYVNFDGHQLSLRAPREKGDHTVFLEPKVYQALQHWLEEEQEGRMKAHLEGRL